MRRGGTLNLAIGWRLKLEAMNWTLQQQVTRKRKDGSTYTDWQDLGYFQPGRKGIAQATERLVWLRLSEGEYLGVAEAIEACERLSDGLARAVEPLWRAA